MSELLMVNTPEWQAFMDEHIRSQPTPIGRATMTWVRDRFVSGEKVVHGSEMGHFQDGWLAREKEVSILRACALDSWQRLHRQTCRIFCCKGHDRECAYPMPPTLAADQPATTEPLEGVKGPARFIVYKDHQIVLSCLKDDAPEILAEMVTALRRYAADASWEYQGHTGPSPTPPYWVWRGSDDTWPEQHAQRVLERLEAQQESTFQ